MRTIGFANAEAIGQQIAALFEQGAFDVCTLFFSRFKSVMAQVPTAQQIIPPVFEEADEADGGGAGGPEDQRCCRAACHGGDGCVVGDD